MKRMQSFVAWLRGTTSPPSEASLEQHQRLLASWRQLLGVCIRLHNQLPPEHLPSDVTQGIVRAREEIAHTKETLRQAGENVVDQEDELTVADAYTIEQQLKLLDIHRRNLTLYRTQYQSFGSAFVPPVIVNGLVEGHAQVVAIKRRLREWNVPINDLPVDESALPS